ncbi:MAG: hypothetical protein R3D62_01385 [Xanthobacteraceae bacterium]
MASKQYSAPDETPPRLIASTLLAQSAYYLVVFNLSRVSKKYRSHYDLDHMSGPDRDYTFLLGRRFLSREDVMPKGQRAAPSRIKLLSLSLVVVGIAIVAIVAIFFRSGAFSIVAEGQGASIKLDFKDSRVDLSELLDKLLKQADSSEKRRLVLSILQAHQFYFIPSVEAVTAFRTIEEKSDAASALRRMLYNLEGPFKSPVTFSEADARLVTAFNELYQLDPESPVLTKLWEDSLDFKGIFQLRAIKVSLREDARLDSGVAAACAGSVWLDKIGLISIEDGGPTIGTRIDVPMPCGASVDDPQAGKEFRIWLASEDMATLLGPRTAWGGGETTGAGGPATSRTAKELGGFLVPLPKDLVPQDLRK